ncbi:MAG: N-6 DNA methylase, partial [Oscillibacter sp.]|nr:N-6 DNA methylase [Oscillibacter sp.]
MARGHEARYVPTAQVLSWEDAARRIAKLLDAGQYATDADLVQTNGEDLTETARSLWELYKSLPDGVAAAGNLQFLTRYQGKRYAETIANLAGALENPETRKEITAVYRRFLNEWTADKTAPPLDESLQAYEILRQLEDDSPPRRMPRNALPEQVSFFITDDEIRDALCGTAFRQKNAILRYWQGEHTQQEKAGFLWHEYGYGGHGSAFSGSIGCEMHYRPHGIILKKPNCEDVSLTWQETAILLDGLIARNRYLTPEEQTKYRPQRIANQPDGKDAPVKGNAGESPRTAKPVQPRTNQPNQGPVEKNGRAVPPRQTANPDRTKPTTQPTATPTSQAGTGNEIDEALQQWNGSLDSKRAVAEYMAAHGRERETAAWLAREYGAEDDRTPLRLNIPSVEGETVLSWPQVQRRIAILLRQGRFLTPEESAAIEPQATAPAETAPSPGKKNSPNAEPSTNNEAGHTLPEHTTDTGADYAPKGQSAGKNPANDKKSAKTSATPDTDPPAAVQESAVPDKSADPSPSANNVPVQPAPPALVPGVGNYHITDEHLGEGKPKERFRANMDAIRTLKTIESEGRSATREEQVILSRYVGWGSLADAFDSTKKTWKKEYQELLDALSPEEYEAARASILDAYFTSHAICRAVWETVKNMGFTVGNVLEPSCGVGNFFGTIPEEMSGSRLYGVELDGISGRIAKQLYPDANITVAGFETTSCRDFFDLAVGNVPFGQQRVNDKAYNKLGFSIHNYFFAKALDQVRPGGVVAFITSHHTMDAKSTDVRKYLSQRAELLSAVRLPDNAFKSNAGTDVVTDILFLQKRDHPIEKEQDWVHLARSRNGYPINCYFAKHPEMILGTQSSKSTPYGERVFTVKPFKDRELPDLLREALRNIRGTIQSEELPELDETEALSNVIPADPDVKNFSYTLVEGEPYYRQNSVMVRAELSTAAKERLRGMVELRDCVHRLIDLQMDESVPDSAIRQEQETLNRLYNT